MAVPGSAADDRIRPRDSVIHVILLLAKRTITVLLEATCLSIWFGETAL